MNTFLKDSDNQGGIHSDVPSKIMCFQYLGAIILK